MPVTNDNESCGRSGIGVGRRGGLPVDFIVYVSAVVTLTASEQYNPFLYLHIVIVYAVGHC
jgi:hypothetical protein